MGDFCAAPSVEGGGQSGFLKALLLADADPRVQFTLILLQVLLFWHWLPKVGALVSEFIEAKLGSTESFKNWVSKYHSSLKTSMRVDAASEDVKIFATELVGTSIAVHGVAVLLIGVALALQLVAGIFGSSGLGSDSSSGIPDFGFLVETCVAHAVAVELGYEISDLVRSLYEIVWRCPRVPSDVPSEVPLDVPSDVSSADGAEDEPLVTPSKSISLTSNGAVAPTTQNYADAASGSTLPQTVLISGGWQMFAMKAVHHSLAILAGPLLTTDRVLRSSSAYHQLVFRLELAAALGIFMQAYGYSLDLTKSEGIRAMLISSVLLTPIFLWARGLSFLSLSWELGGQMTQAWCPVLSGVGGAEAFSDGAAFMDGMDFVVSDSNFTFGPVARANISSIEATSESWTKCPRLPIVAVAFAAMSVFNGLLLLDLLKRVRKFGKLDLVNHNLHPSQIEMTSSVDNDEGHTEMVGKTARSDPARK